MDDDVEKVNDVTEIPETLNISVDGLYTKVVFEETANPEADPEDGVNNNGWLKFVLAKTTLTLLAVVAFPEDPLVAVIGTQDITPAEVDCKTEEPVAGEDEGSVYTVFPEAEETNAV